MRLQLRFAEGEELSQADRQQIGAVHMLEELGYCFSDGRWKPALLGSACAEADAMHAVLITRADALSGFVNPAEQEELAAISKAIEAYEAKRWPEGKSAGGKG